MCDSPVALQQARVVGSDGEARRPSHRVTKLLVSRSVLEWHAIEGKSPYAKTTQSLIGDPE